MNFWNRTVLAVAVVGALALAGPAGAQQLPKGDDLLDKYVAATGGKEAYEKLKTRVAKGTIEVAAAGLKGTATMYAAAPNKMLTIVELPGFGTVEDGTDGTVAWSTNPATGPAVKDGAAKEAALRRADFHSEINWRKHYKKAETVGEEQVEGKPCYKVELTTTDGAKRTQYYDKTTNLLVKVVGTEKSPNGDVPTESLVSDYRKVDGVLMPFKTKQKVLNNEINITLEKVEHNVEIPAKRFDVPEEIKKLIGK